MPALLAAYAEERGSASPLPGQFSPPNSLIVPAQLARGAGAELRLRCAPWRSCTAVLVHPCCTPWARPYCRHPRAAERRPRFLGRRTEPIRPNLFALSPFACLYPVASRSPLSRSHHALPGQSSITGSGRPCQISQSVPSRAAPRLSVMAGIPPGPPGPSAQTSHLAPPGCGAGIAP
jgi:hypothetical protein